MRYLIIVCLLTVSCAAPEKRSIEDKYGPRCLSYGFDPGTDAYSLCLVQLAENDRQLLKEMAIRNNQ